jgi:hypothetical protein
MLKNRDREYGKKRKKVWDSFDWKYLGEGSNFLSRNHSLNIGCAMDKYITFMKRYKNKQKRLKIRRELKKEYY